jgi:hypothetical protein
VLNGVGAARMKPQAMGMLVGIKELNRRTQGIKSPVSGWIAVLTTVYAYLSLLTSYVKN